MRKGSPAYKQIVELHLYAALITGVIMVVVSVTGCFLIFERKMDRWFDSGVSYVTPSGTPLAISKVLARLEALLPGKKVRQLDFDDPEAAIVATMSDKSRAYVNGYTGELLGTRKSPPLTFYVRQMHKTLFAGSIGGWIVMITTVTLLFQCFSGIYLWWPLKRIIVKRKGSWIRKNFDLHHAMGFYTSIFVSLICITGLVRYFANITEPAFRWMTNAVQVPRELPSRNIPPPGVAPSSIGVDEAVSIARAELPGDLVRINLPENRTASFVISVRFPGDVTPSGRSWVVLDQYSGEVLARQDAQRIPIGSQMDLINRSIHTGDIWGLPTRILAGLTTLAIVLQTFTGLVMWLNRKKFTMWWKHRKIVPKRKQPPEVVAAI